MIKEFALSFLNLFVEMAPYLILGFVFAGVLRAFFKDAFITKYLGKRSLKSIGLASLFGIPLPLCSCGVVPTGLSLKKQGASTSSTLAFLTSTPQTGVDSIIVTYGFLGLPFTIYKVITSLIMGIFSGAIFNLLSNPDDEKTEINAHIVDEIKGFKAFLHYSFIEMVVTIRKWLLIGLLIAAGISVFVPVELLSDLGLLDNHFLNYMLILFIATPMYICSTASVPIAITLVGKGFSLGSAIVFLIAGPATNAATITVLWKSLGRKATLVYLINILVSTVVFAYFFDVNFSEVAAQWQMPDHMHMSFSWWEYLSAVFLAGLILFTYFSEWQHKRALRLSDSVVYAYEVEGMTCGGCTSKVRTKLLEDPSIGSVHVALPTVCEVEFVGSADANKVKQIVESAGFRFVK